MKTFCLIAAIGSLAATGYYLLTETWTPSGLLLCFFAVMEAAIFTDLRRGM